MLITIKYSSDAKNIEIFPFSDTTHFVSVLPRNKFWIQKNTEKQYEVGEFSDDYLDNKSDQAILVYDSENIAHNRRVFHFMKSFNSKKQIS